MPWEEAVIGSLEQMKCNPSLCCCICNLSYSSSIGVMTTLSQFGGCTCINTNICSVLFCAAYTCPMQAEFKWECKSRVDRNGNLHDCSLFHAEGFTLNVLRRVSDTALFTAGKWFLLCAEWSLLFAKRLVAEALLDLKYHVCKILLGYNLCCRSLA